MVRAVNRTSRRRDINEAAIRILNVGGPVALTLKSLADELGGSITLVTHYYPTREELMQGVLSYALDGYDSELAKREAGATGRERLEILLDWFLPVDEESVSQERGRVLLLANNTGEPWIREYLDSMEARMTQLFREHLRSLVDDADLEMAVDILRAMTNGITLAAIEDPVAWNPAKQRQTLTLAVDTIPFVEAT